MSNGLIYLTPLAACYFRSHGFGIVDMPALNQKPCQIQTWGSVGLNIQINSFQPIDYMTLDVTASNFVFKEIKIGQTDPLVELELTMGPLPLSVIASLSGQGFASILDDAPDWLSEALSHYLIDDIRQGPNRTSLYSAFRPITEATSLKVRCNKLTAKNLQPIASIETALEANTAQPSEMRYN